ncbi:2-isopropylmalate synthase [Marinobacter sp.]|uniref:2-isopropylmalate synthase n=1 Tax=Marinobacter sp. TaxID=50741 RepID=UPI003A93F965
MMHTEAQRQFYLGVAGIRMWYAREALPGAAPSPGFKFPEPDELIQPLVEIHGPVASTPANAVPSRSAPLPSQPDQRGARRIASLQALMEDKNGDISDKELPVQKPSVDAELKLGDEQDNAVPTQAPHVQPGKAFSLNVGVFSGERHILIAAISKEASLRLQETLAVNILKSLGEVQTKSAEWVQWPVFNNRLVAGGSVADLMSVMKHVLGGSAHKKVIILGRIGSADLEAGRDGWLADALERSPDIEFEYSLAELASNPGSKRSLWEQLKPLVRA